MQLLILGGTRFMGSFITEQAVAAGHDVTVMHRGRSATIDLNALGVEQVVGDRANGHEQFAGRAFDAVIDTSAYVPAQVADAVRVLEPNVGHYVFISSGSAYDHALATSDVHEDAPLQGLPPEVAEQALTDPHWPLDMQHYGGLKAASERIVREAFGESRSTFLRSGLIVGPRDYTDRANRWFMRMSEDDKVLAPAPADAPVQWIDARDLAAFALRVATERIAGTMNVIGPEVPLREWVEGVAEGVHSRAKVTWVDPQFLADNGVEYWSDLPLWLPESSGEQGLFRMNSERAVAAGLEVRPLANTAADAMQWLVNAPHDKLPATTSMTRERERELLGAWARHVVELVRGGAAVEG